MHEVVDGVDSGDLVRHELEDEQHQQHRQYPLVGQPRPRRRQVDEAGEPVECAEDDEGDPRIQSGRERETGSRQELEHAHSHASGRVWHG